MVDFNSYLQHAPKATRYPPMGEIQMSDQDDECSCGSCMENEAFRENQRRHFDRWEEGKFRFEEQSLLYPPRVLGYHLASRTWLELNIDYVKEIPQLSSKTAFNKLQLEQRHKELIESLVKSHTTSTEKPPMMEDIVQGKGKGLVILLHGPPGVGKTLTAESVASLAGKPLFAVSPSDIGLDPTDVEHNLESLFEIAARWRAVLLFDEADVFLESRSSNTSDLTRNALVSVLLRVLEYYEGILILTTNRIKQFDIAVQSRVNLGIMYEALEYREKQEIFKQFIESVPKSQIDNRERILDWFAEDPDAKDWFKPLNGRQIRNVLFSAASLCSNEGGRLRLEDIKRMARITFRFQDSLRTIEETARIKAEAHKDYD